MNSHYAESDEMLLSAKAGTVKSDAARFALVDEGLTPEALAGATAVKMSMIAPIGRRAVSVFLGTDGYQKVEHGLCPLLASLLLECLPSFVHQRGGQTVLAERWDGQSHEIVNPSVETVTVDGRIRSILSNGYLFIHFGGERAVISVTPFPPFMKESVVIGVRSNVDSAAFFDRWEDYAREHNYLRGRAFFADGEIIERNRSRSWDDVFLPEETRRTLRTHIEGFMRNRGVLRDMGLKTRRGLIFSGPPGTGKTLLGKVLADTLDTSFIWVLPRHVVDPESIAWIVRLAQIVAPTVLFLEDLDLFSEERGIRVSMCLGELMNQLDGALDSDGILTIATTNRLEVIEKALRNRPGRFDRVVELGAMDEPCRRAMLRRLLPSGSASEDDLSYLVAATGDMTGAQVEEIVNTACLLALDDRTSQTEGGTNQGHIQLCRRHIDVALEEVRAPRQGPVGFRAE